MSESRSFNAFWAIVGVYMVGHHFATKPGFQTKMTEYK
jgi:hypothetical protein